MAHYALISSDGVVGNVIVAEQDFIDSHFPGAIRVDTLTPEPGIGWTYSGGTWTPPAPPTPPAPSPMFTTVQFMKLFTLSELQAVINYQTSITATTDQKQKIAVFMKFFDSSSSINVDITDEPTIQGIELLEAAGLINTGRAAQILANRN